MHVVTRSIEMLVVKSVLTGSGMKMNVDIAVRKAGTDIEAAMK